MNSSIYSGLIAAVISGIVALIGYVINSYFQNKNAKEAIEVQREIAQMEKDEKLFYESQLEWANETRKLIAKFVSDSFRFNIVAKNIKDLSKKVGKLDFDRSEIDGLSEKTANSLRKAGELLSSLNEEVTMIRLYLFHEHDESEKELLNMIDSLETDMNNQIMIDSHLLNKFVDVARKYFDHQMKELKEKTA